jgi:hypothetical protein
MSLGAPGCVFLRWRDARSPLRRGPVRLQQQVCGCYRDTQNGVRREQLNPIGAGRLLVRVRILLRMAWDQFEKEGRPS